MSPGPAHVEGLVPFVHVQDVRTSAAFYELFGFEASNSFEREFRVDDPDGYNLNVTDAAALTPPSQR